MADSKNSTIRLAAVGDLLLTTKPGSPTPGRGLEALSPRLREFFKSCDIVFGNLECTLTGVIASEEQIRSLPVGNVSAVTLGNNHAFDCLDEGFHRLRNLLAELGVPWCGAGESVAQALRPAILEISGIKIAFLGTVDRTTGTNRFAGKSASGVAPLDVDELCETIRKLRQEVNHVIASPHWGEERFRIPSPRQIKEAHAFVDAGASLVLGHHPHVLQGMEVYKNIPIAYSLGNFIANHVYWSDGDFLTWNKFERTGCILTAELDGDNILDVKQIPVYDDGETVDLETSGWGGGCVEKANLMLSRGVSARRYGRERFLIQTIKPILTHLSRIKPSELRPGHLVKAAKLILGRKG